MDPKLKEWLGDRLSADEQTLTLRFAEPVPTGVPDDPTISELVLREPTIGEVEEAAKQTGLASVLALIGVITGKSPRIVRKLSASEYQYASHFLQNFTMAGPPTGEN